jgi:hypothetical protein
MIKNEVRKAYVFSRPNTAGAWTSEGDEFKGRQIKSIKPDRAFTKARRKNQIEGEG